MKTVAIFAFLAFAFCVNATFVQDLVWKASHSCYQKFYGDLKDPITESGFCPQDSSQEFSPEALLDCIDEDEEAEMKPKDKYTRLLLAYYTAEMNKFCTEYEDPIQIRDADEKVSDKISDITDA